MKVDSERKEEDKKDGRGRGERSKRHAGEGRRGRYKRLGKAVWAV